jgi:hypothetical protein
MCCGSVPKVEGAAATGFLSQHRPLAMQAGPDFLHCSHKAQFSTAEEGRRKK